MGSAVSDRSGRTTLTDPGDGDPDDVLAETQRYARLIRVGSRFWMVGGVDVDFGLFRGLQINVDSLRSLVTGGIAFASPDEGEIAREGTTFLLHDKPQKEWLDWRPKITIPAGD